MSPLRSANVHAAGALATLALGVGVAACSPRAPAPSAAEPRPLGPPRVVQGTLEARPLLGDVPARAAALGAGPVAIVASAPVVEGERLGAFVEVPRDACLLAYARSSASLEDIDLAAFADEGNPLAVDEGPDPRPTVLVCPPHPDRVYVAAHAASGEGLCVIAAQLVPRERAPEVARAVAARGALGGGPRAAEAWPGLDDVVRIHRATLGGKWEELRRVAVSVDARAVSSVGLAIEEGACTDVLVVPGEDVAMIDVDVLDADGRVIARAHDGGAARAVTVCSPYTFSGSLAVRPHVGRGLVAVVLAKAKLEAVRELSAQPEVAWIASSQPLEAARAAHAALLGKAGYGPPLSNHTGQLQLGKRATVPVDLPAGACSRVDVVAGAPLSLVEVAAWDDRGSLLGAAEGIDGATLFLCASGKVRLDLATRGRPGPYAAAVRAERWRSPALLAHPLAASRMLGRAASSRAAIHEGVGASARHATLDGAHQYVQDAHIPPGRCLHVTIGAAGEGTGLDLRVYDAVDGEELDRAHGQSTAAVRACAGAQNRTVRVEARATAGQLDAIIGERLVGP